MSAENSQNLREATSSERCPLPMGFGKVVYSCQKFRRILSHSPTKFAIGVHDDFFMELQLGKQLAP